MRARRIAPVKQPRVDQNAPHPPGPRPRVLRGAGRPRHDEGNNEPVKTERLGEDQDEDHSHEQLRLLGGAPHACIADHADRAAGREAAEADRDPGPEVGEAELGAVARLRDHAHDDHRDDQAVWRRRRQRSEMPTGESSGGGRGDCGV